MADEVSVVRLGERTHLDATQTRGIRREQAFSGGGAWVGVAYTTPRVTSGWHHHGDHDTYVYITSGSQLTEFGTDGQKSLDASSGDVIHVGKHIIHRESNPSSEGTVTLIVRVGSGPPVINVEGPSC